MTIIKTMQMRNLHQASIEANIDVKAALLEFSLDHHIPVVAADAACLIDFLR